MPRSTKSSAVKVMAQTPTEDVATLALAAFGTVTVEPSATPAPKAATFTAADVAYVKGARDAMVQSPGSWLSVTLPESVPETMAVTLIDSRWATLKAAAASVNLVPRRSKTDDPRVLRFRFNAPPAN